MINHWGSFLTLVFSSDFLLLCSNTSGRKAMGTINNVMWHYLYVLDMLELVQPSSWLLTTTMRSISAAQHSFIISLLNEGYSHCQIQERTGLGKDTVGRISKEVEGNKENNSGGCPSKLTISTSHSPTSTAWYRVDQARWTQQTRKNQSVNSVFQ